MATAKGKTTATKQTGFKRIDLTNGGFTKESLQKQGFDIGKFDLEDMIPYAQLLSPTDLSADFGMCIKPPQADNAGFVPPQGGAWELRDHLFKNSETAEPLLIATHLQMVVIRRSPTWMFHPSRPPQVYSQELNEAWRISIGENPKKFTYYVLAFIGEEGFLQQKPIRLKAAGSNGYDFGDAFTQMASQVYGVYGKKLSYNDTDTLYSRIVWDLKFDTKTRKTDYGMINYCSAAQSRAVALIPEDTPEAKQIQEWYEMTESWIVPPNAGSGVSELMDASQEATGQAPPAPPQDPQVIARGREAFKQYMAAGWQLPQLRAWASEIVGYQVLKADDVKSQSDLNEIIQGINDRINPQPPATEPPEWDDDVPF